MRHLVLLLYAKLAVHTLQIEKVITRLLRLRQHVHSMSMIVHSCLKNTVIELNIIIFGVRFIVFSYLYLF